MFVKNLRSVNISLSYRQESWLSHALCVPGHCIAERRRTRQIYWVWLLLFTVFTLILTWLRLLSNWCKPVLTCQLTSSETDWMLMICERIFAVFFAAAAAYSQLFCELLCKYLLVSELYNAHIIRRVFFDNNFQSLNLACVVVCSCNSWAWRFLEDVFHKVG